ncbi:lysosome-associated membrane glycoprotein 5-like [Glandiceps talaboti]
MTKSVFLDSYRARGSSEPVPDKDPSQVSAQTKTTTAAPSKNETTVAPKSTAVATTAAGQVTTEGPTTPTYGQWTIKNAENKTCMMAQMATDFTIQYVKSDDTTDKVDVSLPFDADASTSVCGSKNSTLVLTFSGGWSVKMYFSKDGDDKNYYMRRYELVYVYDNTFPGAKEQGKEATATRIEEDFKTDVGKSYKCDASNDIEVNDDVTMDIHDFHIQPFALDAEEGWGEASKCTIDILEENKIPIIVGVCIIVAVIVIIIGCCCYRSRRKRYEAV